MKVLLHGEIPISLMEEKFFKEFIRKVSTPFGKGTHASRETQYLLLLFPATLLSIRSLSVTAYSFFWFVGIDILYRCSDCHVSLQLAGLKAETSRPQPPLVTVRRKKQDRL